MEKKHADKASFKECLEEIQIFFPITTLLLYKELFVYNFSGNFDEKISKFKQVVFLVI